MKETLAIETGIKDDLNKILNLPREFIVQCSLEVAMDPAQLEKEFWLTHNCRTERFQKMPRRRSGETKDISDYFSVIFQNLTRTGSKDKLQLWDFLFRRAQGHSTAKGMAGRDRTCTRKYGCPGGLADRRLH